jgi:hypothetical protein
MTKMTTSAPSSKAKCTCGHPFSLAGTPRCFGTSSHGARWSILQRLIEESQARKPLSIDAHLAARAIGHGATLCTTAREFTRFKGMRLLNPPE